MTEKHNNFF